MTEPNQGRPNPKQLILEIEEFVNNPPPDVVEKMRQMHQKRQEMPSSASLGELMTKRLG